MAALPTVPSESAHHRVFPTRYGPPARPFGRKAQPPRSCANSQTAMGGRAPIMSRGHVSRSGERAPAATASALHSAFKGLVRPLPPRGSVRCSADAQRPDRAAESRVSRCRDVSTSHGRGLDAGRRAEQSADVVDPAVAPRRPIVVRRAEPRMPPLASVAVGRNLNCVAVGSIDEGEDCADTTDRRPASESGLHRDGGSTSADRGHSGDVRARGGCAPSQS